MLLGNTGGEINLDARGVSCEVDGVVAALPIQQGRDGRPFALNDGLLILQAGCVVEGKGIIAQARTNDHLRLFLRVEDEGIVAFIAVHQRVGLIVGIIDE